MAAATPPFALCWFAILSCCSDHIVWMRSMSCICGLLATSSAMPPAGGVACGTGAGAAAEDDEPAFPAGAALPVAPVAAPVPASDKSRHSGESETTGQSDRIRKSAGRLDRVLEPLAQQTSPLVLGLGVRRA